MPSNHLILCHPLLLLPSVFPSNTVCSNESVLHISGQSIGVSASLSFLPMNTQDWPPLGWTGWISLQSKGTLKSLLQHHSSKASILQCSAFFIVQLSHPYINIGSYKHIFDGQLFKSCFPFHTETTDELKKKKKKKIQWGFLVGLECIFRFHLLVAVVQSLSCVWFFVTPWTAAHQAPLSSTNSQSFLRFMSTESVILSNHLFLCFPLLLLPSIFPSIRFFPNDLALFIRWP